MKAWLLFALGTLAYFLNKYVGRKDKVKAPSISFWVKDNWAQPSHAGIAFSIYGDLNYGDIRNNIFYGQSNFSYPVLFTGNTSGCEVTNYNVNKNIVFGCDNSIRYNHGTYPATFVSLNDVDDELSQDPLFISPSDYRLQVHSPAIDAGIDVSAITGGTDFHGASLYGAAYDIGAFEYQGTGRALLIIDNKIATTNYKIILIDH